MFFISVPLRNLSNFLYVDVSDTTTNLLSYLSSGFHKLWNSRRSFSSLTRYTNLYIAYCSLVSCNFRPSSVHFFKMIAIISLFWKLIISPRHNWKLLIRVHELLLIKSRTGKFENQTLHETICCYSWMINQRTYYQMWYYVLYRNSSFQIMYLITTDLIIRTLEVALSEIGNGLETTRIYHSALSQKVKYLMQRYVF